MFDFRQFLAGEAPCGSRFRVGARQGTSDQAIGLIPSTPRRKFEPHTGMRHATRGFPFMVHLKGFAMVALK
jgi:hypothetical protein